MEDLQRQLREEVLANPMRFNLEKLKILLDIDWETTFESKMPSFRDMILLHEWLIPFQVKLSDEEYSLIRAAVEKWGLEIVADEYPVPAFHTLTFRDSTNDTRGFISKIARGDHILDKARGNVTKYEYHYCATAGRGRFVTDSLSSKSWTLREHLDYISKHIKSDQES